MVMTKVISAPFSFSLRLLWYLLLGFALYWAGNVLAAFPWLLNRTLGIIAMFISVILWVYMSWYSLRHVPEKERGKDSFAMALIFLLVAVIQDYFLYAVYRGIPEELYHVTTFLAYGLVFLIPIMVRYIIRKKGSAEGTVPISKTAYLITGLIGLGSLILTLWSIRFW
jgi:hypothetical protein